MMQMRVPHRARLARLPLNRIVLSGFGIIIGMVLLLGTVSYYGHYRMDALHERNQQSYATMSTLRAVKDNMTDADSNIRAYFSGNGWRSYSGDNAAAVFAVEEGRLVADVMIPGVTEWDVQFFQGPFPLERGEKYIVTFDARSSIPRSVQVVLENSVNYKRHIVQPIQLGSDWETHTFEFVMAHESDVLMQLGFQLGQVGSAMPDRAHRAQFDRIGLVEAGTGKQLIKNGDFHQPDVDRILSDAASRIRDALSEAAKLTSDHIGQQQLLQVLTAHMETWRRNNEVLIRSLLAELKLSGSLGVGLELQSREGILALAAEMEETIERIESIERRKLAESEVQAEQYRLVVYGTLGGALVLIVCVFIGLYLYVNRSIVRPIERTTAILRDMSGLEARDEATAERLEHEMGAASVEVHALHRHIADYARLLHNQMRIDGMTGLFNRKGFDRRIEELLQAQEPFALVLMDIDHFKQVNDTYGHLAGDEVLRMLAAAMLAEQDGAGGFCFRYGGEEFGILLTGRDAAQACEMVERIREAFAAAELPSGIAATFSAGVTAAQPDDTPDAVLERADHALYLSKTGGRNKTTISP